MTRSYEFMIVVDPAVEMTDKSATDLVKKLVGDGAKISEVRLLGKKPLAYPVRKHEEGSYILAILTGGNIHVRDIEKKVQLGTEVLRYLLTAKN